MGRSKHVTRRQTRRLADKKSSVEIEEAAEAMYEKLRMRAWLEKHINSGKVTGLDWVSKEERIFRVPWKHGSLRGWTFRDVDIFKLWAQHTDKYDPQNEDTKRWKANFRCALNSLPDVERVKNTRSYDSKGKNAYRLYKFMEEKRKKAKRCGGRRRTSLNQVPFNGCTCMAAKCEKQNLTEDREDCKMRTTVLESCEQRPFSEVDQTPSSSRRSSYQPQQSVAELDLNGNKVPAISHEEEVTTLTPSPSSTGMSDEEVLELIEHLSNATNSPQSERDADSPSTQSPIADSKFHTDWDEEILNEMTSSPIPTPRFFIQPGDYDTRIQALSDNASSMSTIQSTLTWKTVGIAAPTVTDLSVLCNAQVPETVRMFAE